MDTMSFPICAPCGADQHDDCTGDHPRYCGCSQGLDALAHRLRHMPYVPAGFLDDLDDGDYRPWMRGAKEHEERGGGLSQADLPLTPAERAKLGIGERDA